MEFIDALGPAGRAGGVDHVGQVLPVQRHAGIVAGLGGQRFGQLVDAEHGAVRRRQAPASTRRCVSRTAPRRPSACAPAAPAGTRGPAARRRRAGLEHRQQADHQLGRALHADADEDVRAGPQPPEPVRELVGPRGSAPRSSGCCPSQRGASASGVLRGPAASKHSWIQPAPGQCRAVALWSAEDAPPVAAQQVQPADGLVRALDHELGQAAESRPPSPRPSARRTGHGRIRSSRSARPRR